MITTNQNQKLILDEFFHYERKPERLYFYEDFNGLDPFRDLKLKYQKHLLYLEKSILEKHYETLFKTFTVFMVTISPIPNLDMVFQKKCQKIIAEQYVKNNISGCLYNFEMHVKGEIETEEDEEPITRRLHSHALIFTNKKVFKRNNNQSDLITSFFQKKIMLDKQKVHVDVITKHTRLEHCTKYILGIKQLKYKQENSRKDRDWRKTVNLKDYYLNIPNMSRNKNNMKKRMETQEMRLKYHMECLIQKVKSEVKFTLTFD